jgi:hypothetical protein
MAENISEQHESADYDYVYQTTVNNTYEVVYYYEYIFDCDVDLVYSGYFAFYVKCFKMFTSYTICKMY